MFVFCFFKDYTSTAVVETNPCFLFMNMKRLDKKLLNLHCQCLTTAAVLYTSISESQVRHNSSDASPGSSQVNPFNRQGGTILLPALPAPGFSQHQASSSSLGLQLSQGYTQMYGGRLNGEIVDTFLIVCNTIWPYTYVSFKTCVFLSFSKPTGPSLLRWQDDWGPSAGSEKCHLWGYRPSPQIPWILPRCWGRGSRPQGH